MGVVAGLLVSDGVVLAGDRTVAEDGRIRTRSHLKIHEVDGLGIALEGPVGDAESVLRHIEGEARRYRMERGHPMGVEAAARVISDYVKSHKMGALVIVAGMDGGRPAIRAVGPGGGVLMDRLAAWGSGSQLVLGALEAEKGGDVESALVWLRSAIEAASKRDAFTGGGVDTWSLREGA